MSKKIRLLDSTLRDGMQAEGIAFSVEDKLRIAHALDELGISYIEAGNPGSNPKDFEFFKQIKQNPLKTSELCAFGSTRRKGIKAEEDANLEALISADTPACSVFGKSWLLHVEKVINTTPEENLAMIFDTVEFLADRGRTVIFDAEHFFDGFLEDEKYALDALNAAKDGGAKVLCLCDTRGGCMPHEIERITKLIKESFPDTEIGIHCHNDTGMAVAQSISAVTGGAKHIQGTLTGFGERCGNANLSTIIGDLQILSDYELIPDDRLNLLAPTARRVDDIANIFLPSNMPFVGAGAFAHKGGMHVDGVKKLSRSFELLEPEKVGNTRRYLMSEVSGKATVQKAVERALPGLMANDELLRKIVEALKQREFEGYQYESAEQSLELLVRDIIGLQKQFYTLEYFKIIGEQPLSEGAYPASAIVKVRVEGEAKISGAEGNGPVNALDIALKSALSGFYPALSDVRLKDFKVRVIESSDTTAAKVRVLIESTDGLHSWSTVGVSNDIIEASFIALNDSILYKLTMDDLNKR